MGVQRHKYEYQINPDTAGAKIVRMVGAGKRVLELGSGPGSITRHLHANGCRVTALELDESAIAIVTEFCEAVYRCDLNDPHWPERIAGTGPFELIVAGDVLEHLYDPWTTLRQMQPMLADDGAVVVSLPHIGHNAVVACLLNEDFEYQPWGLLDRTHIRFWGIKNMQKLFEDAGFRIVEVDFVVRAPEQTEFANRWRKLPDNVRAALEWNRFGNVYQVVLRAVPQRATPRGLDIEAQPVADPARGGYSGGARGHPALGYLISFLSLETRAKLSRFLQRLGIRH